MSAEILIPIAIIAVLELTVVLLFWFKHLRYRKNHIIYRIRHPYFWIVSLCTAPLVILIRAVSICAFLHHPDFSFEIFTEFQLMTILLMGFSFPFGRFYFLWYALKLQRHVQKALISQYIDSASITSPFSNANKTTAPFLYSHAEFFGQPKRAFVSFELCLFALTSVHWVAVVVGADTRIPELILRFVIGALLFSFLFIVISLWCCTKSRICSKAIENNKANSTMLNPSDSFRDDFNFRLEMTLMILVLIVGFFGIVLCANTVKDLEPTHTKYQTTYIISAVVTLVVQSIGIATQIYIPYLTLQKNLTLFNDEAEESHVVSLLDILRHKYGFFLFMEQLVQELSFENLSFLIEVFQFKHITDDDIDKYRKKRKFKSYFGHKKKPSHPKTVPPLSTGLTTVHSESFATLDDSNGKLQTHLSLSLENSCSYTSDSCVFTEYSLRKGTADNEYYSRILSKMPWNGLPLAHSICSVEACDKLSQAQNIYYKYIDCNAYDRINCSADTFFQIENGLKKLYAWKLNHETNLLNAKNITPNHVNDASKFSFEMEAATMEDILTEKEWMELLLKVFDVALHEIFDNLDDCMNRFRLTNTFKMFTQSKQ